MTQDEIFNPEALGEVIDAVTVRLEELLAVYALPGRSMVLAVVVTQDGMGGGHTVMSGDALLEGAEGLEFLAAQLRGQG